jgi:undecaprenyl-diphosphatase
MTLLYVIILGIIQGLTEFLPVSSSGHLVLAEALLPTFSRHGILFEILLHVGTLIAVIIYFRHDLSRITYSFLGKKSIEQEERKKYRRVGWLILFAMVPTGIIALLLRSSVEHSFTRPVIAGIFLLISGSLLFATKFFPAKGRLLTAMRIKDALVIGIMQGLAVFPGLTRSGATISGGIFSGVDKEAAARFSFLLSIPAITAALIFDLPELRYLAKVNAQLLAYYLVGAAAAGAVGYLSIGWLLKIIRQFHLFLFSFYCWAIGLIAIIFWLIKS